MNTSVDAMALDTERPRTPRAAPHATHKFKLLLKREFWEHKGGFFWAPIWAGGVSLVLTLMALIVGEVAARRAVASGKMTFDGDVNINGLDLGALTSKMDAGDLQKLAGGIDVSTLMSSAWPLIVLAFVVFFYCLGSLYDERKDRSVLFWKSLPVSDRDTVLSKAASALLVAPTIAVGVAIVCMFCFLLLLSAAVLLHNGNPIELIWGPGNLLKLAGSMLAMIPVYALWALPTVGWLLLCSAWSRSKPILWAILLPVFAGIFVTWFDIMNVFNLESGWFWKNIVARGLLSAVPGTWFDVANISSAHITSSEAARQMDSVHQFLSLQTTYSVLLTPQLWIGAAAGLAMIYAAIRLRRWRDEG
jgi:ABC-2 type transport system permease protein